MILVWVSFVFAADLTTAVPKAAVAVAFEVNCGSQIYAPVQDKPNNFVPWVAKLPVQNVAGYYNLCYGLGASKGQLECGKGGTCCQLSPLATWEGRASLKHGNYTKLRNVVLLTKREGVSAARSAAAVCCFYRLLVWGELCLRRSMAASSVARLKECGMCYLGNADSKVSSPAFKLPPYILLQNISDFTVR